MVVVAMAMAMPLLLPVSTPNWRGLGSCPSAPLAGLCMSMAAPSVMGISSLVVGGQLTCTSLGGEEALLLLGMLLSPAVSVSMP